MPFVAAFLGIRVHAQRRRVDEVGLAGLGVPAPLAGAERAMEAAGFHHAHIEVVEDLRVALGDGVADQAVVRDPGVPVQHRVGRERGLGQSRDDRRFR